MLPSGESRVHGVPLTEVAKAEFRSTLSHLLEFLASRTEVQLRWQHMMPVESWEQQRGTDPTTRRFLKEAHHVPALTLPWCGQTFGATMRAHAH